jgi:hypothetical protein
MLLLRGYQGRCAPPLNMAGWCKQKAGTVLKQAKPKQKK